MNSLSWMIYAADVVNSVSTVLTLVSIISAIMAGFCIITWASSASYPTVYSWEDRETRYAEHRQFRVIVKGIIRPAIYMFLGCAIIASVIPGRTTIYAIAASEAGEQLAKTDTASKALTALNAWLDKQITPGATQ